MDSKGDEMIPALNDDQLKAYEALNGTENIFLTGAAGTGKSFVLQHWIEMRKAEGETIPVLASTGAAAILIGGRTFHAFFGVGILEGGAAATVRRALGDGRLVRRMQNTNCVIIDEVSMISGPYLAVAEEIVRKARGEDKPWGGMRVIVVGDFSQLPPVNPFVKKREWAFLDPVWDRSGFKTVALKQVMRTNEAPFLSFLNKIRMGHCDQDVVSFLKAREHSSPPNEITRLHSKKDPAEKWNKMKLEELETEIAIFKTEYEGDELSLKQFKKHAPIPEELRLAVGAFVMFRQNDQQRRWANGTTGTVIGFLYEGEDAIVQVELKDGRVVEVEKQVFKLLDKDGMVKATAANFPLSLAWAITIHKSQGITCDQISVDIRSLWEPGQAYVALSRCRSAEGLFVTGWNPRAIFADLEVKTFYRKEGIV